MTKTTTEYVTTDGRRFDNACNSNSHQEHLDARNIVNRLARVIDFYLVTNQEEYNAVYLIAFGTKPHTNAFYCNPSSYPFFVNVSYSYYDEFYKKDVPQTIELLPSDIFEMSALLTALANGTITRRYSY